MRFLLAFALLIAPAFALDTGLTLGVSATSNPLEGDAAWAAPTNALVNNSDAAVVMNADTGDTTELLWVLFSFDTTGWATIEGVEVHYRVRANNSSDFAEATVQLIVGGALSGANKSDSSYYTSSNVTRERGGASDTWSLSLEPSDLSGDFGVAIKASDDGSGSGDDIWIEAVWMRITYTTSGEGEGEGEAMSAGFFALTGTNN